jgi:hypothetical protein
MSRLHDRRVHNFVFRKVSTRFYAFVRLCSISVVDFRIGELSKATLDAFWLSGRQHQIFSNDQPGLKLLLRWIGKSKAALTVFEATGVYDRQLQAQLAAHGLPSDALS